MISQDKYDIQVKMCFKKNKLKKKQKNPDWLDENGADQIP